VAKKKERKKKEKRIEIKKEKKRKRGFCLALADARVFFLCAILLGIMRKSCISEESTERDAKIAARDNGNNVRAPTRILL